MAKSSLTWGDTPEEKKLLIGPLLGLIPGGWRAIDQIGVIMNHIDLVLQLAARPSGTPVGQKGNSLVIDILKGAYMRKEPGKWTLYGEETQKLTHFVRSTLHEIQFPSQEPVQTSHSANTTTPANEGKYEIAA